MYAIRSYYGFRLILEELRDRFENIGNIDERLLDLYHAKLYFRDGHKIVHQAVDALAVRFNGLDEPEGMLFVVDSTFKERVGKALDRRNRP